MKYALTILTCLALSSILPELAAMTHTSADTHAFSLGYALRHTPPWLFHILSETPQACWLVTIGILLIALSWFVRHRASRRAAQRSL
jgi:hypothetical protein